LARDATAQSTVSYSSTPDIAIVGEQTTSAFVQDERKTITALFADLKDSTELIRELDPEGARAIVDPALKIMVDAVRHYDGYVVQSTGDGIFALFGAPLAYEDHPQRALHAALRMREALQQRAKRLAAEGKPLIEVRIGINSGEVVMRAVETGGRVEYTPVGYVTNLAARMQTVAPAGEIAISEETRRLIKGYFELRPLGPTEVKGVAEPINVYQVTGLGPLRTHFEISTRRGLTKFVGREKELDHLRRAFEIASGGRGQLVAIVAEAGAGKSRLIFEFKTSLASGCKLLEAYSVSHGKASAWLPVLALLRDYFHIGSGDAAAARRERVQTALAALDPALNDTTPYVFGLLGIQETPDPLAQMDPQIRQRRTLDAIKRIIIRESLVQPTVIIFEDLHWIDSETQALLDLLADSIANARALLVINYRPEYQHKWTNKSYYSQLRLGALEPESADEVLGELLGESAELDPLKHMMIERTQGNPFFIEEMVQALFDEGALVRNGTVKVARPLGQLRMPATVQGILAARIDRLPREEKDLLQTLAVVGLEAPLTLIRKMVTRPQIERMLGNLQAGEFIYEQAASGEAQYTFKHALTQEVAYNSLLIEHRKILHERAGVAIESLYAGRLDDQLRELARHYSSSDNVNKAVEYLDRAGSQAMQRSAHTEAINSLNAAIQLLQGLPESRDRLHRELILLMTFGSALIPVKGWAGPEVERTFIRARELCQRLDDPPELFFVLHGLWVVHLVRAEFPVAHEIGDELMQRAKHANERILLIFAHQTLGMTVYAMGNFLRARWHLEETVRLGAHDRHRALGVDLEVVCLSYLSQVLWYLGYPHQGLERAKQAIALAQVLSDPFSLAFAQSFLSSIHLLRREVRELGQNTEQMLALCTQHGFVFWSGYAVFHRGVSMVRQQRTEGIAQMEEGLAVVSTTGAQTRRPDALCLLAEAYGEAGRLDEALVVLDEALTAIDEHEDRLYEAETHRLRGELLLKQDASNGAAAEDCFRRAIEITQKQSAKSMELQATTSLARLLRDTGRYDDARATLAEIYDWFTEGFDTADLKDAKALLDELNG
jgi:class 3 adenylate cyclase/predicted ATPase